MKISMKEIAWAAGFYEGEGTFTKNGVCSVTQKDIWPLQFLQSNFGGEITEYNGYHYWRIYGGRARGFLLTIFTFLSPRRRRQILEHPLFFRDPNFLPSNFCAKGHEFTPENTVIEKGYKENGDPRTWRACKICLKAKSLKKSNKKFLGTLIDETKYQAALKQLVEDCKKMKPEGVE